MMMFPTTKNWFQRQQFVLLSEDAENSNQEVVAVTVDFFSL